MIDRLPSGHNRDAFGCDHSPFCSLYSFAGLTRVAAVNPRLLLTFNASAKRLDSNSTPVRLVSVFRLGGFALT